MNREIKFRAWDYQNNRWATDNDVEGSIRLNFCLKDYFINKAGEKALRFSFMQYTGLKDKNGKEIYEGDKTERGYVIMWSVEHALFCEHFFLEFNKVWSEASYPMDSERIKIIGNIYENPKILDTKKI